MTHHLPLLSSTQAHNVSIPWADIQQNLASLVPKDIIHPSHEFVGFEEDEEGVVVFFRKTSGSNGDSGSDGEITMARAKILIGVDGLFSVVRKGIVIGEDEVSGNGCTLYVVENSTYC